MILKPPRIVHVHQRHEAPAAKVLPEAQFDVSRCRLRKCWCHSGGLSIPCIDRRFIIDLMKAPEV